MITTSRPKLAEIAAWPATVSLPEAASALGMSRSASYALARRGEFPAKVIRVGTRLRVVTSSLVKLLSVDE